MDDFERKQSKWRNPSDCGTDRYDCAHPQSIYDPVCDGFVGGESRSELDAGLVVDLNCAGPKHALFKDLDGSLYGSSGSLLGYLPSDSRSYTIDGNGSITQGSSLNGETDGPCTYQPQYKVSASGYIVHKMSGIGGKMVLDKSPRH